MTDWRPKIRLFVDAPLSPGQDVVLTEQAHYLTGVMRLKEGAEIALFNGRDGEWAAAITAANKRKVAAIVERPTAAQQDPPDLWLLFAPIKKARTDFIVEKATELGAARILPVVTQFTNAERVRIDRLSAHAREAAEQCGGTYVPQVAGAQRLERVLEHWPADRRLMFCDERLFGPTDAQDQIRRIGPGPWAVLIGPEGGFSDAERDRLRAHPASCAVSLGPRILRADTAAVAALSLWQATLGDW